MTMPSKDQQDQQLNDEIAMRALYEGCGISQETIEAAIEMRRKNPVHLEKEIRRKKLSTHSRRKQVSI
jgi:DNA-binding XRE family transcriptional regulator